MIAKERFIKNTKVCTQCKRVFPATTEYFYKNKYSKDGLRSNCKFCFNGCMDIYKETDSYKASIKKYRQSKIGIATNKKYQQSIKGRKTQSKAHAKYRKTINGKNIINRANTKWHNANKDKIRNYDRKAQAKRKRNLNYIELFENPFPKDVPIVGHHISDAFVVYIPRSLHLNHLHGTNTILHRDELKPFVESIYNFTYILENC